jgi:hypothetical protein
LGCHMKVVPFQCLSYIHVHFFFKLLSSVLHASV